MKPAKAIDPRSIPLFEEMTWPDVEKAARGLGLGSRLTEQCIRTARELGYRRLTLWTNDVLVSARRIYQAAGFTRVSEERHHSFGKDLVGQYWALDL